MLALIYFRALNRKAQKVLNSPPKVNIAVYRNVRVWFKGFDIMSRKNKFLFDPLKPLYSFNNADLYVQSDKLIVIPKTKMRGGFWGKQIMLQPFAICWMGREVQEVLVTMLTTHIKTRLTGNDIEIEFRDHEYAKNITLIVKKIGKELFELLEGKAQTAGLRNDK